ncbi:hypothetical protein JHD50_08930, partial [Sulfurimonas sp. MAG313]
MKRRKFIKNSAILGASAGISTQLSGCGSSSKNNGSAGIHAEKTLTINYLHDLALSPQSHYDSLTSEEQTYLDTYFPNYSPSSVPHNHPNDEVYLVNHQGAQKLSKESTSSTNNNEKRKLFKSNNAQTYSYETTMIKDNYAIHMFYKKINNTNLYMYSDEDDIVQDSPPQYSLAALVLIVPNDSNSDENITFSNAPREIAKALIFSTPAFQHFSQSDLSYALSKFDDIFLGNDLYGNPTKKNRTSLEKVINHVGLQNWYYYQAYRDNDGIATLRKTDSVDSKGNIIHKIGDPIYTFPLKDSLSIHLQSDLNKVIQYFSVDERLSSVLLPTQKNLSNVQQRMKSMQKKILEKSITNDDGIKYDIDTSSLKSQGVKIDLKKVDGNGLHIRASNHYNRHVKISVIYIDVDGFVIALDTQSADISIPSLLPETTVVSKTYVKKVGTLSPRYALMAIPLVDYIQDFTIPILSNAHTVRIIVGAFSFNDGH